MAIEVPIIKRYSLQEFEIEIEIDKNQSGKLILVFPYDVSYSQWAPTHKKWFYWKPCG